MHCFGVCIHCLDNISCLSDTDEPFADPQPPVFEWESPESVGMEHVLLNLSPSPEAGVGISVQGRLKKNSEFWLNELEPSSFVAGIVTDGYRLPFIRMPDPLHHLNPWRMLFLSALQLMI